MTVGSAHDPAAVGAGAAEAARDTPSLGALGRGVLDEILAVVRERLRLLALEGQQFAQAAGQLLTLGVIAAVFVLTAWFVLVGGLLVLVVQLGVPWPLALAGGALVNLAAALAVWFAMRRLLALMMFPATLRGLQLTRAAPSPAAPESDLARTLPDQGQRSGGALAAGPEADPSLRATP